MSLAPECKFADPPLRLGNATADPATVRLTGPSRRVRPESETLAGSIGTEVEPVPVVLAASEGDVERESRHPIPLWRLQGSLDHPDSRGPPRMRGEPHHPGPYWPQSTDADAAVRSRQNGHVRARTGWPTPMPSCSKSRRPVIGHLSESSDGSRRSHETGCCVHAWSTLNPHSLAPWHSTFCVACSSDVCLAVLQTTQGTWRDISHVRATHVTRTR